MLEYLVELHKGNYRQGPGSEKETERAIELLDLDMSKEYRVLDLGCGTGAQTMTLAKNIPGTIVAVDIFDEFLEEVEDRAKKMGFSHKVKTHNCSMDSLNFEIESFDIIWSEGAIYNLGFKKGVETVSKFLKPGGYIALSEITWSTGSRPRSLEEHWNSEYPEIDTASNKVKVLEDAGFRPLGYFLLPKECWIDNYYKPLEESYDDFLKRYNSDSTSIEIVEGEKREIALYKQYSMYYSYGFYIAKKV